MKKPELRPLEVLQRMLKKIDNASGSPSFTAREHERIRIAVAKLQTERLTALHTLIRIGERYILPGVPGMGLELHGLIASMKGEQT